MIHRALGFFLSLLTCLQGAAADPKYPVAEIPAALLKDAKAVIRQNDVVFEVTGIDKATEKVKVVITILNKNGVDNSIFTEGYDKFSSIRKIQTTVYDKDGFPVKNGLNTSVKDIAAIDGYSLYEDNRVKVYDPKYTTTPFTVEYSFERVYNGLLYYPAWIVYPDYNVSVQESSFTVRAPEGFNFRYLERNILKPFTSEVKEGLKSQTWTESNLPALREEVFAEHFLNYIPSVMLAPDLFKIGGYEGCAKTWSEFGLWIKKLNTDRDQLGPETCEKIKSMIEGIECDKEKVRILYRFMQDKVRYVSIQDGIGGWQPIEAKVVDEVSYGDCKALANFMKSILNVAGIYSDYTLVRAGDDAPLMLKNFPSNQFNHAILCVPLNGDTIWLECTDQLIPFGFLGSFTDDREVLLITDSGGKIVKTRRYTIDENTQVRKAAVKISTDGSAYSKLYSDYRGIKYDEQYILLRLDDTDKKNYLQKRIRLPNYNLVSFEYAEEDSLIPALHEKLVLEIPGYASKTGSKLFLKPNMFTRLEKTPLKTIKRNSSVEVRRAYNEIDTLTFEFEGVFNPEEEKSDFNLTSKFGNYHSEIRYENGRLLYIRNLKLEKGRYPVSEYSSFADFLEKIKVEDDKQIVLTRLL